MENFVNEITVMQYYIDQIDADNISFLKGKDAKKAEIRSLVEQLKDADKMNSKIQTACTLWKKLFESAMSYISPDKEGYDKLFAYFDAYVEFEELIFASDSFYRDHTLHCIWVYFLGEYIKHNEQFADLFADQKNEIQAIDALIEIFEKIEPENSRIKFLKEKKTQIEHVTNFDDAIRCISSLTHDLGYPLKKVEKINKSIKKVLPYYSINNFDDFHFEFENIQKSFVDTFIDFISRSYSIYIDINDVTGPLAEHLSFFETDRYGNIRKANMANIEKTSDAVKKQYIQSLDISDLFDYSVHLKYAYYNDFENYKHGMMSAFLLCKNLRAFQYVDFNHRKDKLSPAIAFPRERMIAIHDILASITNHTCDNFKIKALTSEAYLTFIDELEEFSRISRASQNREYVKEFCDTSITLEDGWFDIKFYFRNAELDNLNPEISFKGRCKRFLSLFDIPELSPYLKIRVTCIGELPNNQNTYVLEVAKKHADILINGESVDIPSYLKSTQFYTKEEYATL